MAASNLSEPSVQPSASPFTLCLNTATLRAHKLPLAELVDLTARSGYQAIEPWVDEIERHAAEGGSLTDLAGRIADLGLSVPSAIGFFEWAVDDADRRARALEAARRAMALVRRIGGVRIAAPASGATDAPVALPALAERYRDLLAAGAEEGVIPQLEVWGFSRTLGKLSEALYVAAEADDPRACILGDVYHFYKGGTGFHGIRMLGPDSMHVFHMNDYPADPPRDRIADRDRVFPGDGVAPLAQTLADLRYVGFRGALSLELFNPEHATMDPSVVAKIGAEKMQRLVEEG
jgi:sugar phosphate isomerase/epimerase